MMSCVLVTGGTGLIGHHLIPMLLATGLDVVCLVQSGSDTSRLPANVKTYVWNATMRQIDYQAFDGVDSIVHLAGAGIADRRWTRQRRAELVCSRVDTLNLLLDHIQQQNIMVKTLVSASAIGYYGIDTNEARLTEQSPAGDDFAARLVQSWEGAADRAAELGVRVVKLRTGIVLSAAGGALPKFMLPVRFGFGAPLGSGDQYQSWIHIDDICALYRDALVNTNWQGVYNAVAPEVTTNETITRILAKLMRRPLWLPNVPRFVLKILLGELADLVLSSNHIVNKRISIETTFKYKFPSIADALEDLI